MAIGYGASLPLHTTTEDGPYALLKTMESVASQNLKNLVLTSPGERVMDNKFGVGIRNYLFWQYTPATLSDIESRIRQQVARYIPYINIRQVNFNGDGTALVGSSMSDNFLSIEIKYQIVPLNIGAVLTLPFSA
jgi:phage baseplate assembly protein W